MDRTPARSHLAFAASISALPQVWTAGEESFLQRCVRNSFSPFFSVLPQPSLQQSFFPKRPSLPSTMQVFYSHFSRFPLSYVRPVLFPRSFFFLITVFEFSNIARRPANSLFPSSGGRSIIPPVRPFPNRHAPSIFSFQVLPFFTLVRLFEESLFNVRGFLLPFFFE